LFLLYFYLIIFTKDIIYYHLITIDDYELEYDDIDGVEINLRFGESYYKYRIDIKTNFKQHNFWLFDDEKWIFVEKYVKEIVESQYNSIQEKYKLINLSNDAYFDKQSENVYYEMNIRLRKDKLNKIQDSSIIENDIFL